MFAKHLSVRTETETAYMALAAGISLLAGKAEKLLKEVKQAGTRYNQKILQMTNWLAGDLRDLTAQTEFMVERLKKPPGERALNT